MMSDTERAGDASRVQASEPVVVENPTIVPAGATDEVPPAAAGEQGNMIDETTAGDGVAFFEGGDGSESARSDIERTG